MAEALHPEMSDSSTTYVQWLAAYDEALEVGQPPPALDQVPTEQRDRALHTAPLLHLLHRVRENQSSGEITKTGGVPRTGRRPTQKVAPDSLPRRIGRFEITGYLGRGGMGIVYQGWDEQLRRPVAIKVLRDADPTRLSRFQAEAEMLAHLTHPHIVHVYEASVDAGQPYLVMEMIPGWSLADVLRGRPVAAEESAALVELLAQTLHYAHRQGIIHRDLKPANVLLAPRTDALTPDQPFQADAYEIRVSDFGLGRRTGSDSGLTKTGDIIGTPGYMAPEQAAGSRDQGPSVDIYTLGAVLYEMLTGRPPFTATTGTLAVYQVLHADPLPPSRLVVGLSLELERICLQCLHKNPARRYASAEALALDLHCFRTGQPISIRPPGVSQRIGRWLRAHLLASTLAGLVVAAAGVLVALLPPPQGNRLDQELHQERSLHQQLREEFRAAREENKAHLQQANARIDQTHQSLKNLLAILCQGTNEEALPVQALQALEHAEQLFRNEVEEAEIAQAKALLLAADKDHLAEEDHYRQRQAHAHTWLGRIALQRNQLKPAEEHFRKATTATTGSNGASSLDQLICHTWLAQFHLDRNQVQEAQGELRHCDRHALILNQGSERSPEALLALIYHERFHARLAGQMQDLQLDADALVRQIALCRQLRQEKHYRRTATVLLFQACSFLGDAECKLHRLEAAERSLRDGLTAARELCAETPALLEPRRYVAVALYNLAKVLQGQGKPFEPDLRRAQDCYQRLVDDYSTSVPCRLGLAQTLDQLGLLEMASNRLPQAEQTLRRSVDLFKKLVAERSDPPMDLLQSLGGCLCNLGSALCDGGRPREALPLFEEAINVLNKQGLPERGTVARQFLCNCWTNVGVGWVKLQKHAEAAQSFENASGLAEGEQRERLRAERCRCLFRSGQTETALQAVKEQVEEGKAGLGPLVNLAGTVALAAQAEKNAERAEELKFHALTLLEKAEQTGLSRQPGLRQALAESEEFAVLRERPAFRKLMQTK